MRFELFIARRYLKAKRRQAFIGIITAISIAGVAAGVASLIVALAINNGFRQDLQDRLLGSTAHVSLLRIESDGIQNWRTLLDKLERAPHVVAAAPAIYEQVLISRGPRARGAVLKGMLPRYERRVSDLLQTVNIGSADELAASVEPSQQISGAGEGAKGDASDQDAGSNARTTQSPSPQVSSPRSSSAQVSPDDLSGVHRRVAAMPPIVLGHDLADEVGATVGSVVLVTSPQGELTPFGMVPKYIRFRVVGIFNSGFYDYDSSWAFIRLADAQGLFGLGDVISVIQFKLDDIYRAPEVGREIEERADQVTGSRGFMTTNWMEQNKPLFHALRLERLVTFITIGLIVFVAALNILISLTMMVMEKTKDIAVLMSMGTKKRQIRRIFIAQGVLIGVIGTLIGLALGFGISWAGGHYHFISLAPEVYSIDYVPFAPRVMDGLIVALVSIGISFVATIYPSWTAARILPAEALRYE
ncbi:MAG TPA: FtsX-like permease family protein [Terriglobales bacterium]|nr:FtsX-like permease family protein [Terriglobales bacterium]